MVGSSWICLIRRPSRRSMAVLVTVALAATTLRAQNVHAASENRPEWADPEAFEVARRLAEEQRVITRYKIFGRSLMTVVPVVSVGVGAYTLGIGYFAVAAGSFLAGNFIEDHVVELEGKSGATRRELRRLLRRRLGQPDVPSQWNASQLDSMSRILERSVEKDVSRAIERYLEAAKRASSRGCNVGRDSDTAPAESVGAPRAAGGLGRGDCVGVGLAR